MAESTIDEVCSNLRKYYEFMQIEYEKDDEPVFSGVCEASGFDDEMMHDDINGEVEQSMLVEELADDFPLPGDLNTSKHEYIMKILRKCRQSNCSFADLASGLPAYDAKLFEAITNDDITNTQQLYQNHCAAIYNQGMNTDKGLLQIIAIGRNNKFDYLQNLVDIFDRDRVKHLKDNPDKGLQVMQWVKTGGNKHILGLQKLNVTRLAKKENESKSVIKASELVGAAIHSFGHRCCNRLLFNSLQKIDDSIPDILSYASAALDFITNLVDAQSKSLQNVCPFQFDVCMCTGAPIERKEKEQFENNDEEEDDDSDDDDTDEDETKNPDPMDKDGKFVDYIGDIQSKLDQDGKDNKLKHIKYKQDPENEKFGYREFDELFKALQKEIIPKSQSGTEHNGGNVFPFRKRFISMIDRRVSKDGSKPDDIWMYEPPKGKTGQYTSDIPQNEASLWYVSASRTCLLPAKKFDEKTAIGDTNMDKLNNVKNTGKTPAVDVNIGASFHAKGGLFTLSFHVKAADEIKCYLFWNGQMIRLMADEIEDVFPQIFNMKNQNNVDYFKSEDFKIISGNMREKLIDKEFEAFKASYNNNQQLRISNGFVWKNTEKKPAVDVNIGASFHAKGGLFTLSFHVKAADEIKCYLFWNGQMIRLIPDEIEQVFSQIFNMKNQNNADYFEAEDFKIILGNMREKLIDKEFEAFQASYN
eukprot:CAMPEP_0201594154 /NCGR_PEP_ID=MMETSP0190_2-20130828/191552_1 /ASSEMBLY_ACC=CAM_ASM_000263 /TAXON_ID=37353 /ORGANISM="Rosalina sp." /LENGTH=698 /DNA_ID=CAMNT_0048053647 /DNA_START=22 /DNA_END=2119 /DNA_ORIENTATION=-